MDAPKGCQERFPRSIARARQVDGEGQMATRQTGAIDIAVIGGGIAGTSIAWHLARRRAGRVVLFERATIASGASGQTGALLRRHYSNRPEAILAHAGHATFRDWTEIVGGDPVHTPWPLLVTLDLQAGHESNRERLIRNVALQNEVGVSSQVIDAEELRRLQPSAHFADTEVAAFEADSGYVDAVAATRGMARAAIAAGAEIREWTPVVAIESSDDRVTGVRTGNVTIAVGQVVCATGPWSAPLVATAGLDLPIEPIRVQVAVLNRPLDLEDPHFVYLDTVAGFFCRPWGPGRTLIGVSGGDQHDPVDPDAYDRRNDPSYGQRAIAAIARRIPGMARASYLHGHAGLYDMTPDAHPILSHAGPSGLYLAAGFSGAGFKKGPAVGQAIAELMLDGQSSLVDLAPFTIDRFATDRWRSPWSADEYTFTTDFGHGF